MGEPASSIVLVGMMAAGKSSVGRRLAERRGWEFFDSDRQIEGVTGRTVAEIWRTDGEPAFRRIEAEVLADALASTTPRVVAAAGGTVLDPRSRRLMDMHRPVVWLRARPETLAARVGSGSAVHRPLLDEDPTGVLQRLEAVRRPFYEEVADITVDVDDLTAEQVVACIEAALEHGVAGPRDGEHGVAGQRDGEHGVAGPRDGVAGPRDGEHGVAGQRAGQRDGVAGPRDGKRG